VVSNTRLKNLRVLHRITLAKSRSLALEISPEFRSGELLAFKGPRAVGLVILPEGNSLRAEGVEGFGEEILLGEFDRLVCIGLAEGHVEDRDSGEPVAKAIVVEPVLAVDLVRILPTVMSRIEATSLFDPDAIILLA
jgi:hypothetical protein